VLAVGASAEAKGPQGVGAGASSSNSASSSSQGIGSNSWPQPPGWSKAEDSKGAFRYSGKNSLREWFKTDSVPVAISK
jgi:hypothetical protein